jgi:hypothetical protein
LGGSLPERIDGLAEFTLMRCAARLLLDNGMHDGVFEIAIELAVGIIGLDHHDADDFLFGIDAEVGPVSAILSETALRNALVGGN